MAERRASWPWRKKTTLKVDKAVLSHAQQISPVSSFKYETLPSSRQNGRQEPIAQILVEDPGLVEANRLREQAEARVNSLEEQLRNALEDVSSNEALAKQHEKVMEEAVSGWEKAEKESLSYKQELEVATKQKVLLEDRVAHLDGALKECMKQVRHVKEEQEKKIEDTIVAKTKEWEKVKAEIDARQLELERRLMESEAQNSAMTRSMQERAKKILEATEAREKAEAQGKVLQVKVVSLEKEISALKYELHVLNKEVEIRNEEVECNKKAADASHKQHLENVKKVAKLEADCQRLRNLLRKKLPGPAAIAQMRREVDMPSPREGVTADAKRRQSKSPTNGSFLFLPSYGGEISSNSRDVELLKDRMSSMEEETKLLREVLSKRNEELNASRKLCAKTANKLCMAEDHIESLQGTPKEAIVEVSEANATNELSVGSVPKDAPPSANAEENCAESWASALISELALFKKGNPVPENIKECAEPRSATETSALDGEVPGAQGVSNQAENAGIEQTMEDSIVYVGLQELDLLCRELDCNFSVIQEQLKLLKSENVDISQEALKSLLCSFDIVHEKFLHLRKVINHIEDVRQTCGAIQPSSPATMASSDELSLLHPIPISSLRTVLSKLVHTLEALLLQPKQSSEFNSSKDLDLPLEQKDCLPEEETAAKAWDRQKEVLNASKESFLEGKSPVTEFLLHFGIVLCEACDLEHPELEELLGSVNSVSNPQLSDVSSSGYLNELAVVRDQLQQTVSAKTELELQIASITEELGGIKIELDASKELVVKLQHEEACLQAMEKNLAEVEEVKVQLQQKLKNAEEDKIALQTRVESLTQELAEEKKERESAVAKCEELEHQLEGRLLYEAECNGLKVPDDEDTRLSKERELAAAKEKLAECQRTILALGKQLSALSSPPTELSPGGSFDTISMDSMIEQRMQMELQSGAASMEHHPSTQQSYHHSHHGIDGRYNGDPTSPAAAGGGGQYNLSHSSRRAAAATQQPAVNSGWRAARPRAFTEEMQLDAQQQRSWAKGAARHRNGGPEHPHQRTYQQPPVLPVLQRRPAYVSPSCQYNAHAQAQFDAGSPAWAPIYLPEEDERQLALAGYSPPHTAISSPARSPGRFTHQLRSGQQASGRPPTRTSLTESMNAAADITGTFGDLKTPTPKGSAIGKLFSRSRNNR